MSYTIWGYNKHGLARCYALHVPPSEEKEYLERARKEGWTNLMVDRKPQPALWDDSEIPESASSESVKSVHKKKPRSKK